MSDLKTVELKDRHDGVKIQTPFGTFSMIHYGHEVLIMADSSVQILPRSGNSLVIQTLK